MLRPLLVSTTCFFGSTSFAASLDILDLDLRVDSIGFSTVTIYNDDSMDDLEFDFLEVNDDVWQISTPYTRFDIGDTISLTAEIDEQSGQLDSCSIGGFSCSNAFGQLNDDTFNIGDGAGMTSWGDFYLDGGISAGSQASLSTFSGDLNYETLDGGEFVSWDMYIHNFTVSKNNLTLGVVPVPASFPLLVAALGSLGFISRRRRKSGVDNLHLNM